MKIRINGDERSVQEGTSIAQLLAELKMAPDKVAVERNRRLVRAAQYDTVLTEGDDIEIVTFVGGG